MERTETREPDYFPPDLPRYSERRAARRLGIAASTLGRLRKEGEIECFEPLPGTFRYSDAQLRAFMERVRRPAIRPIASMRPTRPRPRREAADLISEAATIN